MTSAVFFLLRLPIILALIYFLHFMPPIPLPVTKSLTIQQSTSHVSLVKINSVLSSVQNEIRGQNNATEWQKKKKKSGESVRPHKS